jgi:hypothetical protein
MIGNSFVALVPGVALHAQYRVADGRRLAVTADDTWAEDVVNILLLSPAFEMIDVLSIGGAYAPMDIVSEISSLGQDSLRFEFLGRWKVKVHPASARFRRVPKGAPMAPGPFGSAQRWLKPTFLELFEDA